MKQYYVYVLRCRDRTYYTGITGNIEARVWQHENGLDETCYTFRRRPVKLIHAEVFNQVEDAIRFEKKLKGWSRAKKEALFAGDWELVKALARSTREASPTLRQAQGDKGSSG
jgi:putative endonuclease